MSKLGDALKPGLGALLAFAVVQQVGVVLADHGLKCVCPPTGALAVLLFLMPGAPASQPTCVVLAHVLAAAAASLCVDYYPAALAELVPPTSGAVVLAIVAMKAFGAVHPPAAAYAFLFAMQKMPPVMIVKGPGLLGALVLLAVQQGAYLPALKALEAKGKTA